MNLCVQSTLSETQRHQSVQGCHLRQTSNSSRCPSFPIHEVWFLRCGAVVRRMGSQPNLLEHGGNVWHGLLQVPGASTCDRSCGHHGIPSQGLLRVYCAGTDPCDDGDTNRATLPLDARQAGRKSNRGNDAGDRRVYSITLKKSPSSPWNVGSLYFKAWLVVPF